MPLLEYADVTIHYEEYGAGYPVLLFAPGGLMSRIDDWTNKSPAPYDPRREFAEDFRLIAMDQRNAGRSYAPIHATDGWHSFAQDHLALLDHLGIDRFHVMGSCIGCSMALRLMQEAAGRVTAAVLQQPIGRADDNEEQSVSQLRRWAQSLELDRQPDEATIEALYKTLYGDGFVFSVSRDFVRTCDVPMLVLPGEDKSHPRSISLEVADLAPDATVLEGWKAATPEIVETVRWFLLRRVPD